MMNSGNSDCKCYLAIWLKFILYCLNDFNSGCVCRAAFSGYTSFMAYLFAVVHFPRRWAMNLDLVALQEAGKGGT